MPSGRRLETSGFKGRGRNSTYWTWPIWDFPLSLDAVRTVLALRELQSDALPRADLLSRGIVEIYQSQRLTIGKYRNFSPARAVQRFESQRLQLFAALSAFLIEFCRRS
jgi:hypothetical protein